MLYETIHLQLFAEENAAGNPGETGDMVPDAGERQDFESLIRGPYKAEFDQRVRRILDGRLRSLRRENEELRRGSMRQQELARAAFARLEQQSSQVQAVYPEFDWQREVKNDGFARLIAAGVEPRTAYEVVHRQEILSRVMAYAAHRSAAQAARTVASGARRVAENGRRSAAVSRSDPRALSPRELADIRKRVMDGEKIRF